MSPHGSILKDLFYPKEFLQTHKKLILGNLDFDSFLTNSTLFYSYQWYKNYASFCGPDNHFIQTFKSNEFAARVVLILQNLRVLNTFFYAFSLSGFATERYFLVCRATENTFMQIHRYRNLFYVILTVAPFIFWAPSVGLLFWD